MGDLINRYPLGPNGPAMYTKESIAQLQADHAARVAELEARLAQCFRTAGSDPDGNSDSRLAEWAVDAVKELRNDYTEACEEAHQLRQRAERAEAEARGLRLELQAAKRWRDSGDPPDECPCATECMHIGNCMGRCNAALKDTP